MKHPSPAVQIKGVIDHGRMRGHRRCHEINAALIENQRQRVKKPETVGCFEIKNTRTCSIDFRVFKKLNLCSYRLNNFLRNIRPLAALKKGLYRRKGPEKNIPHVPCQLVLHQNMGTCIRIVIVKKALKGVDHLTVGQGTDIRFLNIKTVVQKYACGLFKKTLAVGRGSHHNFIPAFVGA